MAFYIQDPIFSRGYSFHEGLLEACRDSVFIKNLNYNCGFNCFDSSPSFKTKKKILMKWSISFFSNKEIYI